jgi:hypothetical protein
MWDLNYSANSPSRRYNCEQQQQQQHNKKLTPAAYVLWLLH